MDDSQNQSPITTQPPSSAPGEEHTLVQFPSSTPQTQPQQTTPVPPVQQQPISTPQSGKETAPMPTHTVAELMQPVEEVPEIELEPEIEDAGVQAVNDKPQLLPEEKNILAEAKESVSMDKVVQQNTKFPISPQKAEQVTKGPLIFKNASNPMLWLAFLILRYDQLEKLKEKKDKQNI